MIAKKPFLRTGQSLVLSLAFFLVFAPVNAGTTPGSSSGEHPQVHFKTSGVNEDDVLDYLDNRGYEVIIVYERDENISWEAYTIKDNQLINTTIHVTEWGIVGHEDVFL